MKTNSYDGRYHLAGGFSHADTAWKYTLLGKYFFGIRNGVLLFLINLLVYVVTDNEIFIGKLALAAAAATAFSCFSLERWMKPKNRIKAFRIGAVMMFATVLFLTGKISLFTLFAFGILNAVFEPLFTIPFHSAAYNIIDKTNKKDLRIEYIVLQEVALNTGRLTGVILFIIVLSKWDSLDVIRGFLLVIGSMQLNLLLFLKKLDFDVDIV